MFTYRGYGIGYAKTEVNFPLDTKAYDAIMRTVLYKAFRKLEEIISSKCGLQTV